jgi:Fic family protein
VRQTGRYVSISTTGEKATAFIPNALPPDPRISPTPELDALLAKAHLALGRLDGVTRILPDTSLLLYMYVRKEAVLSSQIEGTQSSLSDLLLLENQEAPGVPIEDAREVLNYVRAMQHGLKRLREDQFPLSLRLIKEMHGVLLATGRGSQAEAGEFRRSQVWLGGTTAASATFVPPPANEVAACMSDLEKFLNEHPPSMPTVVRAALAHVQFETIHPFHDGNGRLGRLLITLLLCSDGALSEPILYLSLYFKTHRTAYYEHLQKVRTKGDWEGWLTFFLEGVVSTAEAAVELARKMLAMFRDHRETLEARTGRHSNSALRVHERMQRMPLFTVPQMSKVSGLSAPTVKTITDRLLDLGLVTEVSKERRPRLFVYAPYLALLNEQTEVRIRARADSPWALRGGDAPLYRKQLIRMLGWSEGVRAGSRQEFETALSELRPRDAILLRARFGSSRSIEDLAQETGLSASRLRQIEQRALTLLRQKLVAAGEASPKPPRR